MLSHFIGKSTRVQLALDIGTLGGKLASAGGILPSEELGRLLGTTETMPGRLIRKKHTGLFYVILGRGLALTSPKRFPDIPMAFIIEIRNCVVLAPPKFR